jgi:hypothetical protein
MAKRKKRHDPLKVAVSNQIFRIAKAEAKHLSNFICPIYRPKTATEPELIGTGVFLAIGNRKFVLTAGHVFGPPGQGHHQLLIPSHTTGNLTELVGIHVRSKTNQDPRADDTNDVGIVLLEDGLAQQVATDAFVSLELVDVDDIGDFLRAYVAMGFPWRVSPRVCRRSKVARATIFNYASELLKHERWCNLGLTPRSHFLLRYAKRHSRNESGRDMTAPDPHGMSGGPLWRIEVSEGRPTACRLVGIVIEWRKECGGLLAVRMPIVFAGIAQLCPEVAHLIPQTRTLDILITSPPLST